MNITVVPADNLIMVDNAPLSIEFENSDAMHALHWQGDLNTGKGHIEYQDGAYKELSGQKLFDKYVQPFYALWQTEKAKKEFQAQEEYNSLDAAFERLRIMCEEKLSQTDKMVLPDYPISDDYKQKIFEYRQAIRELNHQSGAPWDGDRTLIPWPQFPERED